MVELGLENTFQDLSIGHEVFFHPRPGFEQKEGSQSWSFYVVTRGRVPGIYTHWEDASPQIHRFPGAVHKKVYRLVGSHQCMGQRSSSAYSACPIDAAIHTFLKDIRTRSRSTFHSSPRAAH
ncbi:hypothetical protein B0H14DRAFT_3496291 [Mycena olivaceomarginata]|nr:hypothetical protein B0H14DRAFT_3496291 [Mycena olivaceomarginata]